MATPVPVENRARLPEPEFRRLAAVLGGHATVRRALSWFAAHRPPLSPGGMVAQDEFSFDLLVPMPGGLVLSYDTT